jgi:hypothetical protein
VPSPPEDRTEQGETMRAARSGSHGFYSSLAPLVMADTGTSTTSSNNLDDFVGFSGNLLDGLLAFSSEKYLSSYLWHSSILVFPKFGNDQG